VSLWACGGSTHHADKELNSRLRTCLDKFSIRLSDILWIIQCRTLLRPSIDWPSTHLNDLLHTSQMKASAFGSVRLDVELDIVSACRAGSAAGGIVPNRLPDDDASIDRSLAVCSVSACPVNIIVDIAQPSKSVCKQARTRVQLRFTSSPSSRTILIFRGRPCPPTDKPDHNCPYN